MKEEENKRIIILFNGAPSSGKSEASRYISVAYGAHKFNFKDKLVNLTKEIFNIEDEEWNFYYSRENKDSVSIDKAGGKTAREALIFVSEVLVKPRFGKDYFGRCAIEAIKDINKTLVCGDCGFDQEVRPVIDHFGKDRVFLVKITRDGCSFKNDSRGWVSEYMFNKENVIHIKNDMDKSFYDKLDNLMYNVTRGR